MALRPILGVRGMTALRQRCLRDVNGPLAMDARLVQAAGDGSLLAELHSALQGAQEAWVSQATQRALTNAAVLAGHRALQARFFLRLDSLIGTALRRRLLPPAARSSDASTDEDTPP